MKCIFRTPLSFKTHLHAQDRKRKNVFSQNIFSFNFFNRFTCTLWALILQQEDCWKSTNIVTTAHNNATARTEINNTSRVWELLSRNPVAVVYF